MNLQRVCDCGIGAGAAAVLTIQTDLLLPNAARLETNL